MSRAKPAGGGGGSTDLQPLWVVVPGVVAAIILAVVAAAYTPKWGNELWGYSTAAPCPAQRPAADCVARVPGRADGRSVIESSRSDGVDQAEIQVILDASVASRSPDIPERIDVRIMLSEANDLDIDGTGEPVVVTLFRQAAMEITGPNGRTVHRNNSPAAQFAGTFAMSVIFGLLSIIGVLYLWRRIRRYGLRSRVSGKKPPALMPGWALPALICAGAGLAGALLLGWLAAVLFSGAWLIPTVVGGTVVASVVLATRYRRLRGWAKGRWSSRSTGR